ncbi:MAG: hypothetical protein QG552_2962 [Thermodesulfobacteriota bacterium]|nr:hypothetical protein [Thermodesulfobacteriota bacterium]
MTVFSSTSDMSPFLPPAWGLVLISIVFSPLAVFFPLHLAIFLILAATILAFCVRPMLLVYLMTASYALESCTIELHFENASYYYGYVWVHFFEINNLITLAVIILWYLIGYHRNQNGALCSVPHLYKWIFFLFTTFIAWSAFIALLSSKADVAFFGWWKLNCNFVMMALLIIHLDRYDKFIKVMSLYCGVAFIFSLISIYATHQAFETTKMIYLSPDLSASIKIALFNRPGGVMEKLVGLVNGFGLCGKHQLGMLVLGGILFSVFLAKHYKSWIIRATLVLLICLFEMILYNNVMKLSLTASLLLLILAWLAVLPFRKYFIHILALFICLNIVGWCGSKLIQAPHLAATDEIISKLVTKVPASSQFQVGSIPHRVYIWEQTFDRIIKNPFTGIGPEALRKDLLFNLPHGHNFFLTLTAEYGAPAGMLMLFAFFLVGIYSYHNIFSKDESNSGNNRILWFLKLTFFGASGSALFESLFDCDIWLPHLWFMLALLLGSMNLENRGKQRLNAAVPIHTGYLSMDLA